MDALLLLAAEVLIIGISVWVVTTEAKTPEEIRRRLDVAKPPKKARFADLSAAASRSERPRRS